MTNLSDFFLDKTASGTAVAGEIVAPKKAWVGGVELTGTIPVNDVRPVYDYNGVLIDFLAPKGTTGAYTPAKANHLVFDDAGTFNSTGTWTVNTAGYCHTVSAWALLAQINSLPAWAGTLRRYQIWGTGNSAPGTNAGARIRFNAVDGNNYCEGYIQWDGSVYRLKLYEVVATVANVRVNVALTAAIGHPINFHLTVDDMGDSIWLSMAVFESDTTTDIEAVSGTYYAASRANKSSTNTQFGILSIGDDSFRIQGYRVLDL